MLPGDRSTPMLRWLARLFLAAALLWPYSASAQDAWTTDGDSGLTQRDLGDLRRDLLYRLRVALAEGRDAAVGLQAWFDAQQAEDAARYAEAGALYHKGLAAMPADLPLLKPAPLKPVPKAAEVKLELLETLQIPDSLYAMNGSAPVGGVSLQVARFRVGELTQYGVVLAPEAPGTYPLILYLHGAAFGVPTYSLPYLAEHAAMGYVVAAPSLRGEPLFVDASSLNLDADTYRSEGQIENLVGEVDDALAMAVGAQSLPNVRAGKYAVMGHSFGSGAGLLVPTRTDQVACVISYDAWLTNPFRYYWDRLSGGANNWLSWEAYTEQPVPDQLAGLLQRSVVHQADRIQAPLLLFMGGAYNGSVFHQSHQDLITELRRLEKPFRYEIIPGGGHNFVLYTDSKPALAARAIHLKFLQQHLPPVPPKAAPADAPAPPADPPAPTPDAQP